MTEKRFESKYDGVFIEDRINNRTYCCDAQNDWLSICDLLNELSEENEILKEAFHLFSLLAEDYHLTFDQLFEITQNAIEKRK